MTELAHGINEIHQPAFRLSAAAECHQLSLYYSFTELIIRMLPLEFIYRLQQLD
jgi:hypothetical protein